MIDDPRIDPTPPVQRFAAHHLKISLVVLGVALGLLSWWAFRT